MRHSAWLHTTPEPPKKAGREGPPQISRLAQFRLDNKDPDWQPPMPPVELGDHLLAYLFEVGPTVAAGMGSAVVPFEEWQAWQQGTGIELAPWELRTLRRLSADYLAETQRALKRESEAPWAPDAAPAEIDREAVSKKVQSGLQMLIKTRPKR